MTIDTATAAAPGGQAAATATPPAADPAAAPPAAAAPAQADAAPEWMSGLPDALKGEATLKLFKDVPTLAQSYLETRKVIGHDKLPLPKDDDDKAGWERVYNTLGRPETADKYDLPVAEGDDPKFMDNFKAAAHGAGLSQKQAKGLVEWVNQQWKEMATADQAARTAKLTQEQSALKAEWGAAYDANDAIAGKAAVRFGMTDEHFKAFREAMGFAAAMKFLHTIGIAIGEDQFTHGEKAPVAMTPAAAQEKIDALKKDAEFSAKLRKGDVAARKEWDELHQWAVAGT
jgi:hypothetical protein